MRFLVTFLAIVVSLAPGSAQACGDCNLDGTPTTILDALTAAQIGAGLLPSTMQQDCSCDVNSSGAINVLDALLMAQAAAGIAVGLSCPMTPCGTGGPPIVVITSPLSGAQSGTVTITFDTGDPDLDPLDLDFDFALGAGPFQPASSAGTGSIATNPALGTPLATGQTFDWDTVADAVGGMASQAVTFRIRVEDPGGGMGSDQVVFDVDNSTPAGCATAGRNWTQVFPATRPPARRDASMAFDSLRNVTVLYGGEADPALPFTGAGDTWEYSGNDWTQRITATTPPARALHGMAFDALRGVMVMFSGSQFVWTGPMPGATLYSDTWEYDGVNWSQVFPATTPPQRDFAHMAFDQARGVIVLHGGSMISVPLRDTWTFDGVNWTQVATSGPNNNEISGMTYDTVRQVVLLHSYTDASTWEWDGVSWVMVSAGATPANLTDNLTLAFDTCAGEAIFFGGGVGMPGVTVDETWTWNGSIWQMLTPATIPPSRRLHVTAYDSARQKVILFGGDIWGSFLGDHWEF